MFLKALIMLITYFTIPLLYYNSLGVSAASSSGSFSIAFKTILLPKGKGKAVNSDAVTITITNLITNSKVNAIILAPLLINLKVDPL